MGASARKVLLVAAGVCLSAGAAGAANYAVLFAGGWDKQNNYERYYNSTLSMWDIMVNRLGFDPANVQVLFADGTNTAADQNVGTFENPSYVNSNWNTVTTGGSTVTVGTAGQLQSVLVGLQSEMTSSDCFHFWSFDHGYNDFTPPVEDEGGLCGWNHTKIPDDVFASWVRPYDVQAECYVFGQCYAEEMVDDLEIQPWEQRFAAWATPWNKSSYNLDWVTAWARAIKTQGLRYTYDIGQYAKEEDFQAKIGAKPYGGYLGQNFHIVTNAHHRPQWQLSPPGVGNWATASNWTEGEPTGGSTAYVDNGGTVRVTQADEAVLDLYVASQAAASGRVEMLYGGELDAYKEEVGYAGVGLFSQSGGDNTAEYLIIGNFGGSHGTYEMTGGDLKAQELEVARSGQGWFYQSDGMVKVLGELAMATGNNGYAVYELSGSGWIVAQNECVGENGLALFRQEGGLNSVADTLTLGRWSTSTSSYRITGGTLRADRIVGGLGGSELIIDGGTVDVTSSLSVGILTLGDQAGCNGTYALSGSESLTAETLNVGYYGMGILTQTGGTGRATGGLTLGHRGGGHGVYEMQAGQLDTADLTVGYYGLGDFIHTGGVHAVTGAFIIGLDQDASGIYHLSGSAQLSAPAEEIGLLGGGGFDQSGGVHTVTNDLKLAVLPGSGAFYILQGGTLDVGGRIVGGDGHSEFVYDGGTLIVGTGSISVSLLSVGHTAADARLTIDATHDIAAADEKVGVYGRGTVTQTGGVNAIANDLLLAEYAGSEGTYRIKDGSLLIGGNIVRGAGTSHFIVDGCTVEVGGGSISVGTFTLGSESDCTGSFDLADGMALSADVEQIGGEGAGAMTQTGGVNTCDLLAIGAGAGGSGTYSASGGQLIAGEIQVGVGGSGALHITSPAAEVTVSGPLHFGPDSAFTCAAGATIRLAGPDAALVNENPDPADLPGLSSLALEFLPGEGGLACLEAASALDGGFVENLALEALTLCAEGELVSLLRLVDACDNGHRGAAGRECVFARSLWIEGESQLDLAGVRLYLAGDVELLAAGWVAEGRILDSTIPPELIEVFYDPGNDWTEVKPEPAALVLLAAGALGLLGRRRGTYGRRP